MTERRLEAIESIDKEEELNSSTDTIQENEIYLASCFNSKIKKELNLQSFLSNQSHRTYSSSTTTLTNEKKSSKHVSFGKISIERVESYKKYNRNTTKISFDDLPESECNCILI